MHRLLLALLTLVAPAFAAAQPAKRVAAVENGLRAPIMVAGEPLATSSLGERMKHYHVPGVSIAVVDRGRIAWAKGYGTAGRGQPVAPNTRFQAGSISKPAAAIAAMKLVQAGRLSLDSDVNAALRTWKLPSNAFTRTTPVTLRQLLSHTGGVGVHAFWPGYEPGKPLPSSVQILSGEPPATNPPIQVEAPPGKAFDYSGGGYQIVQQMIADASGSDFSRFVHAQLFKPLRMSASSFEQARPSSAARDYAVGHDRDGVPLPIGWYLHPEMAAAGLWSTPTDLARLGLAVSAAWRGQRSGLFSRRTARMMLTPQVGGWGLGFQLEGTGPGFRFRHGGDNPGYKAVMIVFPARGQGAVVMTNGDRGDRLADEILLSVAAAYGWEDYAPKTKVRASVTAEELARVSGSYALDSMPDARVVIRPKTDSLSFTLVQPSGQSTAEFLPAGNGRFFRRDIDFDLQFSPERPARRVTLIQDGESFTAARMTSNP